MKIRKGGVYRICNKEDYENIYKGQGFVIVDKDYPVGEPIELEEESFKDYSKEDWAKEPKKEIDIEQYSKGGGWYEYEGKSYRKDELLEVIE